MVPAPRNETPIMLAEQRNPERGDMCPACDVPSGSRLQLLRSKIQWHLRDQGRTPAEGGLTHLSPVGWEHINLTGDYHWETSPILGPDQFRPLRTGPHATAAAA